MIKIKIPTQFNKFVREWRAQNPSVLNCEFTPFTKKITMISTTAGFLIGGFYGASNSNYESARKGSIIGGSLIGTALGLNLGLFWTVSPVVIGIPYVLYKTIEIATRPSEEELKRQREYSYDPYAQ
jgi:protein-S-isoprenylcysteine O-methyltransferase Ste14